MKRFDELTKQDLTKLRKEIVLNSLYVHDYQNSFGFADESVCSFFDGYVSYLLATSGTNSITCFVMYISQPNPSPPATTPSDHKSF